MYVGKFRFLRLPISWSVQSTRKVKPRKRKRIAMTPFTNVPDWRPVNYAEAAAWKCETPFSWRVTSNPHPDPVWPTKSPFLSTPIYSTIKKLLAWIRHIIQKPISYGHLEKVCIIKLHRSSQPYSKKNSLAEVARLHCCFHGEAHLLIRSILRISYLFLWSDDLFFRNSSIEY